MKRQEAPPKDLYFQGCRKRKMKIVSMKNIQNKKRLVCS